MQKINYQINIEEMKRKTEIEDRLLFDINKNFQTYLNEIEYVKKNFVEIIEEKENNLETNKYSSINELRKYSNITNKLFEYPNTIYSIFQCFYLKRKNYMGMNLTGLIQGKMETGLGFRSSIVKMSLSNLSNNKDEEIKNIIDKFFVEYETTNINIYKINSNGFEWKNYEVNNYQYIYIVVDFINKKYFFIIEK